MFHGNRRFGPGPSRDSALMPPRNLLAFNGGGGGTLGGLVRGIHVPERGEERRLSSRKDSCVLDVASDMATPAVVVALPYSIVAISR